MGFAEFVVSSSLGFVTSVDILTNNRLFVIYNHSLLGRCS